jgi:hypothetical protein
MSQRSLLVFGGILALGVVVLAAVLIGVFIGSRADLDKDSKEPATKGPLPQKASPATTIVIVRVSGTEGVEYRGTIGTIQTGQTSIEGTLDDTPDDRELPLDTDPESTDNVTASVSNQPGLVDFEQGALRVQLLVDGQVVKEQETSAEPGTVTLTLTAMEARQVR